MRCRDKNRITRLPVIPVGFFAFFALLLLIGSPVAAQSLAGGVTAEEEGTIEIMHEDYDNGTGKFRYFLNTTAGKRIELKFNGTVPSGLSTGDVVRVSGQTTSQTALLESDSALVLDSASTTSLQTLIPVNRNTFGAQKTILFRVKFRDTPTPDPYPFPGLAGTRSLLRTVSNFFLESSYNQTWLTGVIDPASAVDIVGWYTIDLSQNDPVCRFEKIAKLAKAAAVAAGVNLSPYTRHVFAFPSNSCPWAGAAWIGGNPSRAWINGSWNFDMRTVTHELGHNLGLEHSHSLDCAACEPAEYGDFLDVMGGAEDGGHFNPFQKEELGWLGYGSSPPITRVSADGIYTLNAYEAQTSTPKALKILKSSPFDYPATYWYFHYVTPTGFDSALPSGVYLHAGSIPNSGYNGPYLWNLDQSGATLNWQMDIGETFTDTRTNKAITLMSVNGGVATVRVKSTRSCVPANPTMQIAPASQLIVRGNSAAYDVIFTNHDSAGCYEASFKLTKTLPAGLTGSFAPSQLFLLPGGKAKAVLKVAAPATLASGVYNLGVTAARVGGGTTPATGSVSLVVTNTAPTITVSTSKPSYTRGETVIIRASVKDGTTPVSGASVDFSLQKASTFVDRANATTNAAGVATYQVPTAANDNPGAWKTWAEVDTQRSNTLTFTVN